MAGTKMTDAEIMDHLRANSEFSALRQIFSSAYAAIEQAAEQRRPPSPIEVRRMEFEAVERILRKAGVDGERLAGLLRSPSAVETGTSGP